MENPTEQCSKCECKEIGEGRQSGHAGVLPIGKIFPLSSAIIHRICTNCGYVIKSYVENPTKYKG